MTPARTAPGATEQVRGPATVRAGQFDCGQLQRRVTEPSDRLAELTGAAPRQQQWQQQTGGGTDSRLPAGWAPHLRHERTLIHQPTVSCGDWTRVLITLAPGDHVRVRLFGTTKINGPFELRSNDGYNRLVASTTLSRVR